MDKIKVAKELVKLAKSLTNDDMEEIKRYKKSIKDSYDRISKINDAIVSLKDLQLTYGGSSREITEAIKYLKQEFEYAKEKITESTDIINEITNKE